MQILNVLKFKFNHHKLSYLQRDFVVFVAAVICAAGAFFSAKAQQSTLSPQADQNAAAQYISKAPDTAKTDSPRKIIRLERRSKLLSARNPNRFSSAEPGVIDDTLHPDTITGIHNSSRTTDIREDPSFTAALSAQVLSAQADLSSTRSPVSEVRDESNKNFVNPNCVLGVSKDTCPTGLKDTRTASTQRHAKFATGATTRQVKYIQLGSFRDKTRINREWTRLLRMNPEALKGYKPVIETANLGKRGTYYRILIGPFEANQEARIFCTTLRRRGQNCFVKKHVTVAISAEKKAGSMTPGASPPKTRPSPGSAPEITRAASLGRVPAPKSGTQEGAPDRYVQVGSFRDKTRINREWTRLLRMNPEALKGYKPVIETANLGERGTYYRILIGPFEANQEAQNFCTTLRRRGQNCFVKKHVTVAISAEKKAGSMTPGASPTKTRPLPGSAPKIARAVSPLLSGAPVGKSAKSDQDDKAGIAVGSFRLDAGATLSQIFDDNIFATPTDRASDRITTVTPFATLKSEWTKHALNFDASAAFGLYHDYSSENFNDFSVGGDGRFDLGARNTLFGGVRFSRRHEGRDSPDAVSGTEPTVYHDLEAHVGTFQQVGNVTLRLGGTFQDLNFRDVPAMIGEINNDDRDRVVYEAGTRIGYVINDEFEPFLQATLNWRRYDEKNDDFGFKRSSHGLGAVAGLKFNSRGAVSGEALAGYMRQSYADDSFSDVSAPDFGGLLSWKPVSGTQFDLSLDRTNEETTVAGSPGYLNTETRLSLEHAITRSVILSISGSYAVADYQSVSRLDKLTGFSAELRYFPIPNIFVGVEDRFVRRDSNIAAANFDENQLLLHLGGQLSSGYRDGPSSVALDDLGLYAGLQLSHGQLGTKLEGPRGSGGTLDADFGNSGLGGGLFAGYGTNMDKWYFGFEVDGDMSTAGWDHARLPGGRTFDVERGPSVAGTFRFGRWLPAGALLYTRAGVAYADFDTSYRTGSGQRFEQSDERFGLRVGTGIEVPLSNHLFGRLDYSFTDYRNYDVAYTNASDNFDNSELLARFGLGYRLQAIPDRLADTDAAKPSYSGGYIGAQVGYGTLETLNSGPRQNNSVLIADRGGHGANGGIFAGYGLMLGNVFIGAEIDGGLSDAGWDIAREPTGRVYTVAKDESIGASARVGYMLPYGTLAYGRVGIVRSAFNTKYAFSGSSVDQDDTLTGLRFGGGIETPLTGDLFLRFDYTHTSYDTYSVNYGDGIDKFDNEEDTGLVGVGYRF